MGAQALTFGDFICYLLNSENSKETDISISVFTFLIYLDSIFLMEIPEREADVVLVLDVSWIYSLVKSADCIWTYSLVCGVLNT